jgi:signal transduction histidine kinase
VKPGSEIVQVLGDRLALRRILTNLVDNALRYGQTADLEVGADRDQVTLFVDDDGPGIPASKRKLLLEPFTRIEPSRARYTGGAGLGLAIVRQLVEVHGGEIAISDAPSGGARVMVSLPCFKP